MGCFMLKLVKSVMKLTAIIILACLLSSAIGAVKTISGVVYDKRSVSGREVNGLEKERETVTVNLQGQFEVDAVRVAIRDLDKEQIVTHGITTFNPNYIYEQLRSMPSSLKFININSTDRVTIN